MILQMKYKRSLTFLIFVYFVCYAVAPVSSVMPSAMVEAQEPVGVQEDNPADLLLYDLVLWEILKKSRQSDVLCVENFEGDHESRLDSDGVYVQGCLNVVSTATALFFPEQFGYSPSRQNIIAHLYLFFDHSGLSPPARA